MDAMNWVAIIGAAAWTPQIIFILYRTLDQELKELFKQKVLLVGGTEKPRKIPSWNECQFCDISKTDCPERIDVQPTATSADHDLF